MMSFPGSIHARQDEKNPHNVSKDELDFQCTLSCGQWKTGLWWDRRMTSQNPQGYRIQDVFLSLREVWKRDVVYFRVMLKPILEIHYCPKQLSRNGGFHLFLSQLITGGACYEISLSLDSFFHPLSFPLVSLLQSPPPPWAPVFCSSPRPCALCFHVLAPACPARFQCCVSPVFSR